MTATAGRRETEVEFSQRLSRHAEKFIAETVDPKSGGSTYMPHQGEFVPTGYDASIPNRFIVGGVPHPVTGAKIPTHTVLGRQFDVPTVVQGMLRTHLLGQPDRGYGSWVNQEGNIDLDVSSIHGTKREARTVAEGRREQAWFQTRGMRTGLTSFGKKVRNANARARRRKVGP